MRWFERIIAALIFWAIVAGPACAADRLALLIGNQSYNAKVGPLQNPHNDIRLIGAALRSLKFKVTEIKDANYGTIDKAINRHVQNVRREGQGTISLVYRQRETPRLCRGGSSSLTNPTVHQRISNREQPSTRKELHRWTSTKP